MPLALSMQGISAYS